MDAETLADLFAAFGPVQVRRMFGGAGVYADGLMFALAVDGVLYLKADAAFAAALAAQGSAPFTYVAKTGARTMGSYWRVPDAALDEPDDLAVLARRARQVAGAAVLEKTAAKARRVKNVTGPAR
ncbi:MULTISPECIES: TfoX/Sxy family protein [unclassified Xanthobacter]|uniref:TfoX/Sxy family protein n=1 Tax=unclassified Xanthobacter TaxID=2623496 RepID=UPI001EDE585F|nr:MULTISPECIES: TfoX/Sxy family protein [unclassified Xanthobacter]